MFFFNFMKTVLGIFNFKIYHRICDFVSFVYIIKLARLFSGFDLIGSIA